MDFFILLLLCELTFGPIRQGIDTLYSFDLSLKRAQRHDYFLQRQYASVFQL